MKKKVWLILLFSFFADKIIAQQTIGLIQHDSGTIDSGYILFSPINYSKTYLIDKCGKAVHEWNSFYQPGQSLYLLPDGNLLRTGDVNNAIFSAGGKGGVIEKMDWNSNVLWSYFISSDTTCQHHDIRLLPNGNILAIVWESKTIPVAIANGRDPNWINGSVWSEGIIELQPTGINGANIVWEWHMWDHLIQDFDSTKLNFGLVANHPELIDINFPGVGNTQTDWNHMNAVDYNPEFDQILLSNRNFSEIWIIDHSTSKSEAASHIGGNSGKGGDLLYRWGNPQAYKNGLVADKKLFGQHDAHWITSGVPFEGSIILFNNGVNRPNGNFSSIDIISTPVDSFGNYQQTLPFGPSILTWTYQASNPTDFYSQFNSGVQIFENGNVQICSGSKGVFFEIDSSKNTVWNYINPIGATGPMTQGTTPTQNQCFRAEFYPMNFSGFVGHSLIAGLPLEVNPLPYTCELDTAVEIINWVKNATSDKNTFSIYPNPSSDYFILKCNSFDLKNAVVKIYDGIGREIVLPDIISNSEIQFDSKSLNAGIYFISVFSEEKFYRSKFVIAE